LKHVLCSCRLEAIGVIRVRRLYGARSYRFTHTNDAAVDAIFIGRKVRDLGWIVVRERHFLLRFEVSAVFGFNQPILIAVSRPTVAMSQPRAV
jgi:hypothetical protein